MSKLPTLAEIKKQCKEARFLRYVEDHLYYGILVDGQMYEFPVHVTDANVCLKQANATHTVKELWERIQAAKKTKTLRHASVNRIAEDGSPRFSHYIDGVLYYTVDETMLQRRSLTGAVEFGVPTHTHAGVHRLPFQRLESRLHYPTSHILLYEAQRGGWIRQLTE